MTQPKTSLTPEQGADFDRRVMEHLSRRGIKIKSSRDLGNGQWAHDVNYAPGSTIYSRLSAETDKASDKDK